MFKTPVQRGLVGVNVNFSGIESVRIRASRFQFTLSPDDSIYLPVYKGATLRGGFGHAFRRVLCAVRKETCADCLLRERCIYSYIFETPPPSGTAIMRKYTAAPHPFVLEPPEEDSRLYGPGEELYFGLVLIGKAVDYLPYFIYTFDELGRIGLGRGKGRFTLKSVTAGGNVIYTAAAKTIGAFKEELLPLFPAASEYTDKGSETRTLTFKTPARIRYNMSLASEIEFHILVRQLIRRMSLLYYFHCGGDSSGWDFRGIIKEAGEVKAVKQDLRWYDWERYSTRQGERMKMGGIVGSITFEGPLAPFMPLLRAGEILHVGKGTSFGLGRYAMT